MRFVYIADFFFGETLGGAEQNDHELLEILRFRGHEVEELKTDTITAEMLKGRQGCKFIVSNFVFLFNSMKKELIDHYDYVIYEHDHKYLQTRDPSPYEDYKAPESELKDVEFYKAAKAVFVQSALHEEIIIKNLGIDNAYRVGGNIWPESTLDMLEELSKVEKEDKVSIMVSNIDHKNTTGAVRYCEHYGLEYELIQPQAPQDFLKAMSKNDKFIFLPKTVETLSRIIVEARMMGCSVITNDRIGAASEEWFNLKSSELVAIMRQKRQETADKVEEVFDGEIRTRR